MPEVECGFTICEYPNGKKTRGKAVCGTSHNVTVPNDCPIGSRRIAITHTHPGSGSHLLSAKDKFVAGKLNIAVCTKTRGHGTKCFSVRSKRK